LTALHVSPGKADEHTDAIIDNLTAVNKRAHRVSIRSSIVGFRQSWSYWTSRPDWTHSIDSRLTFDEKANSRFSVALESTNRYLEFGSGASTLVASESVPMVVSVESDPAFLTAVERSLATRGTPRTGEVHLLHADIGRTGPWGKPVFPSLSRPRRWRNYPNAPWASLGSDFSADLILIDGRFRVACALSVALNQMNQEWLMLVDDYVGRPEYSPIEQYITLSGTFGRMAEFRPNETVLEHDLQFALARYISDWR